MKDGKAYSWVAMDGMPTFGFTVDQETAKNAAAQLSDEQKKQSEQWRENMSLRCKPWVVDESQFDLPKDVNFDGGMGGMMQGMMSASGSIPSMKGMPSLDSMKAGKVPTPEEIKAMQQIQLKYQNQVQVGQ
jgi:hypothetical protein